MPRYDYLVKSDGTTVNLADITSADYVTNPMTIVSDNTAIDLTQAGTAGKSWYIAYANWRVRGSAVGATDLSVLILDGATTIYDSVIPKTSIDGTNLSMAFPIPIKITAGNAVHFTITASGVTGSQIEANLGLFQK